MKTKTKETKRGMSKMLIGTLIVIAVSSFIILVSSQSNQSLEEELASLESELSNSGYSWFVNYSVNYLQNGGNVK